MKSHAPVTNFLGTPPGGPRRRCRSPPDRRRALKRAHVDLRGNKFKKTLDRALLRIVPAREALVIKDAVILVFTIANLFPATHLGDPDRTALAASDAVHLAFQLAYKDPDLALHAIQAVISPLTPDPVSISLTMICILFKCPPSESP